MNCRLGLVIWDSEEKWLDVKSVVGKEGKDGRRAHTALYNKDRITCTSTAACSYALVRIMLNKLVEPHNGLTVGGIGLKNHWEL